MIISHKHRFIFLKTQKTAGTSIELVLSQLCGPDDVITSHPPEDEKLRKGPGPQNVDIPVARRRPGWRMLKLCGVRPYKAGIRFSGHMSAADVRRAMDRELFDSYRKVTIVRNPWDREVSLYYWAIRGRQKPLSFEEFVRRWVWRPERKTFELYSLDGRIVADTVFRYETLNDDLEAFVSSLGVDRCPEMPRAKGKHRPKDARDYQKLYTPATKAIVEKRHAREIEAFGYEF